MPPGGTRNPGATFLSALVALSLLCLACTGSPRGKATVKPTTSAKPAMLEDYLGQDLWKPRDAYDAGHYLMVPLHSAFANRDSAAEEAFSTFIRRFLDTGQTSLPADAETQLQFSYVLSRFVVLADRAGRDDLVPPGLDAYLYQKVHQWWVGQPHPQWGLPNANATMADRLHWILSNPKVTQSYHRAVQDTELFLLAIAADLRQHERLTGRVSGDSTGDLTSALATAEMMFQQLVVPQPGGGWLFQPGVWTDHDDFLFAGNAQKAGGLQPAKVPGIAEDSSHSFRMPLWLTSLAEAYSADQRQHGFYGQLKAGLEQQLFTKVLVPPTADFPGYRLTNFMDGRNGVYRWGHEGQGPDNGYGPYELSGSLTLRWWAF